MFRCEDMWKLRAACGKARNCQEGHACQHLSSFSTETFVKLQIQLFWPFSQTCRSLVTDSLPRLWWRQYTCNTILYSLSYFTMSESENSSVQLGKMSIAHWLGSLGKRQVTSAAPSSFTFSSSCHRILQETSIGLFRWGPAHQKVPSSP